MLMLLLLFFFSPSFGLPEFFLSTCPCVRSECPCSPRWSRGSLLVPSWFRGDILGRMGRRLRDWSESSMWRVLLARTSVQSQPSPFHSQGVQAALSPGRQPCSSLERRDGWRPEREADSSANSASLDRPSAVLPIVALPRNRRTGHMGGELFFRNSLFFFKFF